MTSLQPAPGTRITNIERERVEGRLKDAYAEGRLDEFELDRRLEAVMSATSRAQLSAAVAGVVPLSAAVRAGLPEPTVTRGRGLAAVAHFSVFVAWLLGPGLCYALAAPGSYARREAAKAFNFQVVSLVGLVSLVVLGSIFEGAFGWLIPLAWLGWFVLTIVGGAKASAGENWTNPVMRVVRWEVLSGGERYTR